MDMDNTSKRSLKTTTPSASIIKRSTAAAAGLAAALTCFTLLGRATAPQVPTGSWAPVDDMSTGRAGASAVLMYDGRMLVTGGMADGGMTTSVERYSQDSGAFLPTPPMLDARASHTSTLLPDGRVLVAGGVVSADAHATNAVEIYDPLANAWTPAAPMNSARAGHTATALFDGRVVITGGDDAGMPIDSIEIFDPYSGAFTVVNAVLTKPRTGHAAEWTNRIASQSVKIDTDTF